MHKKQSVPAISDMYSSYHDACGSHIFDTKEYKTTVNWVESIAHKIQDTICPVETIGLALTPNNFAIIMLYNGVVVTFISGPDYIPQLIIDKLLYDYNITEIKQFQHESFATLDAMTNQEMEDVCLDLFKQVSIYDWYTAITDPVYAADEIQLALWREHDTDTEHVGLFMRNIRGAILDEPISVLRIRGTVGAEGWLFCNANRAYLMVHDCGMCNYSISELMIKEMVCRGIPGALAPGELEICETASLGAQQMQSSYIDDYVGQITATIL